jgi:hypothetical protein
VQDHEPQMSSMISDLMLHTLELANLPQVTSLLLLHLQSLGLMHPFHLLMNP